MCYCYCHDTVHEYGYENYENHCSTTTKTHILQSVCPLVRSVARVFVGTYSLMFLFYGHTHRGNRPSLEMQKRKSPSKPREAKP